MLTEEQAKWADVLADRRRWSVECSDCLPWLASLPEGCLDMVIGSPPYTACRTYLENGQDLGIARAAEEWAAWMVDVTLAALRACKGPVFWVVEGQTVDYRWDAAPVLLAADLHRRGVCLRRPCYYRRVGIPGSGGPDYFRCDAEIVLAITRGGRLPWADVTACGHPPRWAPGGAMSNRQRDGRRCNQWGDAVDANGRPLSRRRGTDGGGDQLERINSKPSHVIREPQTDAPGQLGLDGMPIEEPAESLHPLLRGGGRGKGIGRNKDGSRVTHVSKSHTKRRADGEMQDQSYAPPVLANPGNVVSETYTAAEVDALLGMMGEFVDCQVGGGQMGSPLAHQNEAPYPEQLVERFVRSFCPPGGIVADCYSGSGTTLAVSIRWGRRFVGCELRQSQVELSRRRGLEETPPLPGIV